MQNIFQLIQIQNKKNVLKLYVEKSTSLVTLNLKNSKNNLKIVIAYVSAHYASFGTKNRIWPLLEVGEGVCMSLCVCGNYRLI